MIPFVHFLNSKKSSAQPPKSIDLPVANVVRPGIALERKRGVGRIIILGQRAQQGIIGGVAPWQAEQSLGKTALHDVGMRQTAVTYFQNGVVFGSLTAGGEASEEEKLPCERCC